MSAHWFKQFSPFLFSFLPSSSTPSSEPSSVSQMCVGPRRVGAADRRELVTCILCQEEQEVRSQGRAMVLAAFVQRSTVLSKNRQRNLPDPGRGSIMLSSEQDPISVGVDLDACECVLEHHDPLFMHPDLSLGIHTASCGHIMHASCWQRWDTADAYRQNWDHKLICVCVCFRYFEAVQLKEQRRQQRLRGHTSYNVENGEFLCPLCECLSNTVVPLLPHTETPDHRYISKSDLRSHRNACYQM